MVSVSYPSRLLLDYSFIKWIIKSNPNKAKIITHLLHIHNSSKENKKSQNLIADFDLSKLLSENLVRDKDIIKGCLRGCELDEDTKKIVESEKLNEYQYRGVIAVSLTHEAPCKVTLLTTKPEIENYKSAGFFNELKDVSIKDEVDGEYIINSYFKRFCEEKEMGFCSN